MNVEHLTNEELAAYLTLHHTDYQKLTYEEWQELDAEAARRLRTMIPKPVVEILEELRKAATKFPSWPTDPFHALAIVGEEFGELQQSFLKANYEGADEADRKEAIQLAAMAIRFLMHWDDYAVVDRVQTATLIDNIIKGGE